MRKRKSVFSQVKKNERALERIRGYQGEMQNHPRKMKVCQIERTKKNVVEWKLVKYQKIFKKRKEKKRKEKFARMKTQNGGLGKN